MLNAIKGVFFDLDGTLLDTAFDLAAATNNVLVHHGYPAKSLEFLRPLIGRGVNAIITKAFDIETLHPLFNLYKQELLQSYQLRLTQNTHFFPGMESVLDFLEENKIAWGIVTNKPTWLTEPLIKHLGLSARLNCLVSRETIPFIKPHPIPIIYACRATALAPQHCIYVGDTEADILAAQAAQTYSILATYGYTASTDQPHTWGANHLIDSAWELLSWLKARIRL